MQVERLYLAQTWDNLTDTTKLILMCEVGEHLGGSVIHAAKFLELDSKEMHNICDLQQEEKEREKQLEFDVNMYNLYLLNLGNIAKKDLKSAQHKHIEGLEAEQRRNLKELASSGYDVHREDILTAQRFLRDRCQNQDSAILQAVIDGLEDYIGQDYSIQIVGSIYHDDELEGEEEEDIQLERPEGIQPSAGPTGNIPHIPRARSHLNIVQTADYSDE